MTITLTPHKRTIRISGFDIDVVEQGDGPTILFLHAGEGPEFPSRAYLDALARDYRVIAPWHPGFGGSSLPSDVRRIDDLAYFYLDLADHYDLRNATLMGASFGGWIAAEVAIRSTAHLSKLVLVDPLGIRIGGPTDRDIADIYMRSSWQWPELFYNDPSVGQVDYTAMDDGTLTGIARGREAMVLFGWRPYMHNPVLRRWLSRIDIPTLLLWGRDDKVVSLDYAAAYRNAIPDAKLEVVDNSGHFPHLEQTDAFIAKVREFC